LLVFDYILKYYLKNNDSTSNEEPIDLSGIVLKDRQRSRSKEFKYFE